jgi:hypothetical protein
MNKTITTERLPDSEVKVKVSYCQSCNGWVRIAILHMMSTKTKNEFAKEVMEYNLSVKEVPLLEWRKETTEMCNCNSQKQTS